MRQLTNNELKQLQALQNKNGGRETACGNICPKECRRRTPNITAHSNTPLHGVCRAIRLSGNRVYISGRQRQRNVYRRACSVQRYDECRKKTTYRRGNCRKA